MNAKAKSALLLIATLIVGGVLGALIASRVINHRLDELRRMRSRGGFSQALEEAIQPTGDVQRELIRETLHRSHARMDSINSEWRSKIRNSSDSLRSELEMVLDDDQIARMTKFFEDGHAGRRRSDGNSNSSRRKK